jgi:hypothetical protein
MAIVQLEHFECHKLVASLVGRPPGSSRPAVAFFTRTFFSHKTWKFSSLLILNYLAILEGLEAHAVQVLCGCGTPYESRPCLCRRRRRRARFE